MQRKFLALLLVVSLVFLFGCAGGGGGAISVAKGFLKAIDRGNIGRAKAYITLDPDFRTPSQKDDLLKRLEADVTNLKGEIGRFVIERVDSCTKKDLDNPWSGSNCMNWLFPPIYKNRSGELYNSARVVFKMESKDMKDFVDVIKIKGRWKVAFWNIFYIRPTEWKFP